MDAQRAGELVALLREFALASDRFADVVARRHALHRTDLEALGHLWAGQVRQEPLTPTRLAAALSLSAPATSALIGRLERAGHVARVPSAQDRRSSVLVLPERARDLTAAAFGPLGTRLRAVVGDLRPDEAAVVEQFLRACTDAAEAATADTAAAGVPPPSADSGGGPLHGGGHPRPCGAPKVPGAGVAGPGPSGPASP
ncbi:MarR family winged helix-turn-helix transcriptional regulator [Geodermatophilus sp. SYSU D00766]